MEQCPGSNRRVIGVKRDGTAWCPGCGRRVPVTAISRDEDGELVSHSRPGAGNRE